MTNLDLLAFPQELLIRILSNLDGIAIARCAMTCRRIHETLKNSYLLKYIIQLHCNGVTDSGGTFLTQTRLSYPELIKRLQHRHQEWMSPKWTVDMKLELYYDYDPFSLAGGTLVRRSADEQHLEITMLPTAGSSVDGLHTIERALNNESQFYPACLTIDPTQDLIVLVDNDLPTPQTDTYTIRIHILALSSYEPHPLAQKTPLQFTVALNIEGYTEDLENAHLEIARNTVVLRFYNDFEKTFDLPEPKELRVLVWDWTTSELIFDSLTKPLLPSVKFNFGLLDSTYCFFTSVIDSGSIQLYELTKSPTSDAPPTHLATLHLPRTIPNVTIRMIHAYAGPIETYPLPHNAPFMVNDDDRLHMFRIDYFSADLNAGKGRAMPINLFVHQRVFAKYCVQKKKQAQVKCDDAPLDIPWEEWGPSNTRIIFPSCTLPEWSRHYKHVYGQRVVCHKLRSYEDVMYHDLIYPSYPTNSILILDFSPATVSSVTSILPVPLSSNSRSKPGKLLPPSKISSSRVLLYEDDVETRLPCVSFTTDLEQSYESYMIHADGVVGVNIDRDTETLLLDVYTI